MLASCSKCHAYPRLVAPHARSQKRRVYSGAGRSEVSQLAAALGSFSGQGKRSTPEGEREVPGIAASKLMAV